ncbi:helix-turn-helix domain-containing protein [Clostridium sp. CF012]|uniref:GH39 family glycosyl hydrolase n=1 Tax=Clostridium sp. CF012 TaxID=2843319 RepID=UPI001C0D04A1|nr:helix-turn-helix domain-containing protein [Clostridium sp. CF012]MBU3146869.1 helix-turn-helix domain-containing protein [Clostridium sp. CF012]
MYKYEVINHDERLPIKIFLHNINKYPVHWHEDIEIIFVLEGSIKITEEYKDYVLKEDDIFLFNSNVMHSSEYINQNTTLVIQFDTKYFENYFTGFSGIVFDCKSSLNNTKYESKYNFIRNALANLMMTVQKKDSDYALKANELIFKLVGYLISHFQIKSNKYNFVKPDERLKRIVQYINEHYRSDISLQNIADKEYLSLQYISKYFKEKMGVTFIKYSTSVRLKKSIPDLTYTSKNILNIAIEHGFPNAKSYYKAFEEAFSMTPSAYRRQYQQVLDNNNEINGLNYFNFNPQQALKHLLKYLSIKAEVASGAEKTVTYELNINKEVKMIKHTWRKLMTFGRAAEGLRAEFQRQMREVQKEIPFEYVRFHGIFNDEMMVYNEYEDETPYYNFTYVDELFDFFLECKIKPFIELGFMPGKLASNKEQYIFWWKGNISYPKDINKWLGLIGAFAQHLIKRYGRDEVLSWYFEIWNEPNIKNVFWYETKEAFFNFFNKTLLAIKAIDSRLKVGGPAVINEYKSGATWYDEFLEFVKDENMSFDFFSYHVYPITYDESLLKDIVIRDFNNPQTAPGVSYKYKLGERDFIEGQAKIIKDKVRSHIRKDIEIHITEFNSSVNSRDLVHDTCFMAAFLVHNILRVYKYADSLGYWAFTDIFEEYTAGETTFHGGFGFITNNGIKKPHYYAYYLLNKLGNEVLEQGENYIITKKNTEYQILFYNYCDYDELYKNLETSHISHLDRYNVFEKGETQKLDIRIKGLKKGTYIIKTYKVDRENGSAYDEWIKMGAPQSLHKEEVQWLKKKSLPAYYVKNTKVEDYLEINEELKCHGVMLIEIVSES